METAIYCRVSTEEQKLEGYSIRGQTEKLKSYVSAKSWAIYNVYLDEGISGKNLDERPAINTMIEDIKAGHVKNVLVFKLDRLTRSVADLMFLIELFKNYDCEFNSLTESIDTSTASGRMFLKIIGIFAEFERENIGERIRLGFERKAREGYTLAGITACFGYDRNKGEKVLAINENEAVVIKRIFNLYVNQNVSINGIATILNKDNIPTKQNSTWKAVTVLSVLKNVNLIGQISYCKNTERHFISEGKHEPIISAELFNQAQLLLEENKRATPTKRGKLNNYFVGVLFCGVCGKRFRTQLMHKRGKSSLNYLCVDRIAGACNSKMVAINKVEKAISEYINNISEIKTDTENSEKEKALILAQAKIEELKNKISALDIRDKEFLDLYIVGDSSLEEYRSIKKMLDTERKEIQAEIDSLTPKENKKNLNFKR